MQIGGINTSYNTDSIYSSVFTKYKIQKTSNDSTAEQIANSAKTGPCQDTTSFLYQMEQARSFEKELEYARVNNPQEYKSMLQTIDENAAKSFFKVVENYEKYGSTQHNGIPIHVDSKNKVMSVGDTSQGNVLNVPLSNGWNFAFNRDNMDAVAKMLDIFTPEDLNRIMEAVIKDNIAHSMKKETEDVVQGGEDIGSEEAAGESIESDAIQPIPEEEKEALTDKDSRKIGEPTQPTQFQRRLGLLSYEASFMYA